VSKRQKVLVWAAGIIALLVVLSLLRIPKVVLPGIIIRAETVLHLFGFPITNTLLATWLTMLILILGSWAVTRNLKLVPGRLQGLLEMLIDTFYNLVKGVAGPRWARQFFPIVMTIFLFLVTSNLLGLTPLYGGWGVLEPAEGAHTQGAQPVEWLNESHTLGLWVKAGTPEATAAPESTPAEGEALYMLAPMFLIMPLMVSSVLAADSFAGEKERKTLEALLYTPTTDRELFTAKLLGAWAAAVAVALFSFLVYAVMVNAAGWHSIGHIFFPNWMWVALVFWVTPAVAGLGLVVMVFVSVRAQGFQDAYQTGGLVVLPVLLLMVGQISGVMYFSLGVVVFVGLVIWLIDAVLLWFASKSFRRGELMTKF